MKKLVSAITLIALLLTAVLPMAANAGASEAFTDVIPGKWYCKAIDYCVERGIMSGTSATTFEPDASLTRAMFVTMLAAYDGAEVKEYRQTSPFDDVPAGKWYTDAAIWAYYAGIEQGANGKFAQNTPCTREAMVLYLYRVLTGNQLLPVN